MTQTIHEYRGTIDKYIGDAIVAFWGARLADAEHAGHTALAGLKMQQAPSDLNSDQVTDEP